MMHDITHRISSTRGYSATTDRRETGSPTFHGAPDMTSQLPTPAGPDGASPGTLPFAPPRNRGDRLGPVVVAKLVDDIVSGRLATGAALPTEADLGEQFGVSRTVVRESVKLLQDKGLVNIRHGVGTVVLPESSWDMIDDVVLTALVRHDESLLILDEVVSIRAALE